MPAKSPLDHASTTVKAELLNLDATTTMTTQQLADWLRETHGIALSKSAVNRFIKGSKQRHQNLMAALGLSPDLIAANAEKLEEMRDLLLQRRFIDLRIEKLEINLMDSMIEQEANP